MLLLFSQLQFNKV